MLEIKLLSISSSTVLNMMFCQKLNNKNIVITCHSYVMECKRLQCDQSQYIPTTVTESSLNMKITMLDNMKLVELNKSSLWSWSNLHYYLAYYISNRRWIIGSSTVDHTRANFRLKWDFQTFFGLKDGFFLSKMCYCIGYVQIFLGDPSINMTIHHISRSVALCLIWSDISF